MKKTYEQLVEELRELRLRRDQADAQLLLRLVEIENTSMRVILESGCESFAQFLKSNALVDPGRYEAFKIGLHKLDNDEAALEIGSEATIIAGQLTNGTKKYIEANIAWRNDHGGTKPTRETAKRLLMQVDPRAEIPQSVKRQKELEQLRAENGRLRAEVKSLQAKIRSLEAQLSKKQAKPVNQPV